MTLRISKTGKLDGILSWSLQAIETCPGSVGIDGDLVPACAGCYATTGRYTMENVVAPRRENKEDWQADDWCDRMVAALDNSRYFRWFDSGDMYALHLAYKIYEVMQRTPWCDHWLPTRMAKFAKFREVIDQMQALPNVSVRFSSDSITGDFDPALHGSVIYPNSQQPPAGTTPCRAYENEGKCSGCRACYKKGGVIAYPSHGRKMKSLIFKGYGIVAA